MNVFYKIFILVVFVVCFASNSNATNNYVATTDFTLTINTGEAITIIVEDLAISDVVGGDTIDEDVTMTPTKDPDRDATCSTTALTLTSAGESDITAITAAVNAACTVLSLDGTLPTDAANNKTYAGTITVTYAYDIE